MGIKSTFTGVSAPTLQTDKFINTSYDVVKKVADNLDLLSLVFYSEEAEALREAMVDAQSIVDATNADVVLTNANVVLTNADAATTAANLAAIEDVFGQFDELYLGAKDIPPTVDNNGDPLIVGAVYWDIPTSMLMFYTGVSWVAPDGLATDAAERAEAAAVAAEASVVTSASNAMLTANDVVSTGEDAVSTAEDRIAVEALAEQYETITVSDVPPTPENGVDGDIWFLIP